MSFTFTPQSIPLARPGSIIRVYRYNPDGGDEGKFQALDNIKAISIEYNEGAEPGAARFRYSFDEQLGLPGAPTRLEHVYPLGSVGRFVVRPDDRLVVVRDREQGGYDFLFDGFASIPQADLSKDGESMTFTAMATPVREWDTPLPGAYMRDADDPAVASDVQTNLPLRFNPDGRPNATPSGIDTDHPGETPGENYPTFCGPIGRPTGRDESAPEGEKDVWALNGSNLRHWTLGMAVRYLLARGRRDAEGKPTTWTNVKNWDDIEEGLKLIIPEGDDGPINLRDAATWRYRDAIVQDFDATGDAWPVAVQRIIEPHGFSMCFGLWDDGGEPKWYLCVYRKDTPGPLKRLYLQAVGDTLDPGRTNVGGLHLARDSKQISNRIEIASASNSKEASLVLAPGFAIATADASTPDVYRRTTISKKIDDDNYRKYREFIFDELGEGHWDMGASETVYTLGDLEPVFPVSSGEDRQFVRRRREAGGTLVSVDAAGLPRKAELWVIKASDYGGPVPGLWDGSAADKWQFVQSGEWDLLPDRLGIRLNMENVDQFTFDKPAAGAAAPFPAGVIRVLQSLAAPTDVNPKFYFRLTCVVEADQGIGVVAKKRAASPTRFAITRQVDARDRFQWDVVTKYSHLHPSPGPEGRDINARNDTEKAQDHADSHRRAHERASFAGTVTIPRISLGYQLGDRVAGIEGRDVDLKTNAGGEQGETDTYPVVVGFAWTCEEPQTTTLTLDDRRADPPRRRTR